MTTIRWMRDQDGRLRFYKHNRDLYSDERADEADEIVVLKAIVRIRKKVIVAIPIHRALIGELLPIPDAGGELATNNKLNREAIRAAEIRERELHQTLENE